MNQQQLPPSNQTEQKTNGKSHALIWSTLVILLLGATFFAYWFFYLRFHQFTDDAYANGNMVSINSVVEGSVTGFYADDTDLVIEGQLLVQLDETPYKIALEKEFATLTSILLQVRQIYDTVKANQALVASKKALADKALYDYENRSKLVDSLAISQEDFIHAKDNYTVADLELKQARYQYEVSKDAAGPSLPIHHPRIEEQKENIRKAYYNLKHCAVKAPCTGYIAQRNVDVGEFSPKQKSLMKIIPTEGMWVDANFKETQLTHMRVGQKATVWFDLYGSKVIYKGKVLGIASGSGSVFSIIPPQNATGNWIKIVQRLPVRISLEEDILKEYPARLGISAEVDVDITDQNLPFLVTAPQKAVVAKTDVFLIDFSTLGEQMDKMILEHLTSVTD